MKTSGKRIPGLLTLAAAFLLSSGSAPAQRFASSAGEIVIETIAQGLEHPWALAFLPEGRMLITERPGRMRIVAADGQLSPALAGVPKVFARGDGGLLDVILDRAYARNRTIYFCFAEPIDDGGRTALARAKLIDEGMPRLDEVQADLPAGGTFLEQQPFWLSYCAGGRRQSVSHPGWTVRPTR